LLDSDFEDEEEQKIEEATLEVDLHKLKILCLMVCRGEPKFKAEKLFDIILKVKPGTTPTKTQVVWQNKRMKQSFAFMIKCSEFLPKEFFNLQLKSLVLETFSY
jgi:hypothetical protein